MGYDYYCMGCGKQLSQQTVLFDMQYLLTRDVKRKFNILKFRMTEAELKALVASGTPTENGYRACKLTLPQIMGYIGNTNNLRDPNRADDALIASLTLDEIAEYQKQGMTVTSAAAQQKDDFLDDDELEEEEDLGDEVEAPYVTPASIQAIENKDTALTDRAFTQNSLRSDFEVLQGLFDENGIFAFQIKEECDIDNEKRDVLIGYSLNLTVGGFLKVEARVCPKCGTRVFSHAGTAKHQAVAFIGYQAAGKTSTILALAHYAESYMITGFGSEIWNGCETVDTVATVELLDPSPRLEADLKSYTDGIAPPKTKAGKRADAYSATFLIKNKAQHRNYLFTLTDLPGELCFEDGTVDWANVQNNFPVALSCDAFVACFDTQSMQGGGRAAKKVTNVCKWADAFQQMRASHNQVNTYVPTMLLFTKCQDLEDPNAPALPNKMLKPLDQMYSLKNEKRHIMGNQVYNFVREQFQEQGQLQKAYHAMMRCSPFGYKAPSQDEITAGAVAHPPVPKNIDKLMRWLLSVSGSIPTEATFALNPRAIPYILDDFCIARPQLRSENPLEDCDVDESMARCALFENPGQFDKAFVGKYDSKAMLFVVRANSKMHPNTNAEEER